LWERRFPEKAAALKSASSRSYNLENLPYTVLDLAGVVTVQGESVKEKSLL
jgi:hypothetical protein